jgi:hypothetical protein
MVAYLSNQERETNMNKLKLLYRKVMFLFSKQDLDAILKYDPLNILTDKKVEGIWLEKNE